MYTIEPSAFEHFLAMYQDGAYKEQRIGQAFYNHFELHKANIPPPLDAKIYETHDVGYLKSLLNFH